MKFINLETLVLSKEGAEFLTKLFTSKNGEVIDLSGKDEKDDKDNETIK